MSFLFCLTRVYAERISVFRPARLSRYDPFITAVHPRSSQSMIFTTVVRPPASLPTCSIGFRSLFAVQPTGNRLRSRYRSSNYPRYDHTIVLEDHFDDNSKFLSTSYYCTWPGTTMPVFVFSFADLSFFRQVQQTMAIGDSWRAIRVKSQLILQSKFD